MGIKSLGPAHISGGTDYQEVGITRGHVKICPPNSVIAFWGVSFLRLMSSKNTPLLPHLIALHLLCSVIECYLQIPEIPLLCLSQGLKEKLSLVSLSTTCWGLAL